MTALASATPTIPVPALPIPLSPTAAPPTAPPTAAIPTVAVPAAGTPTPGQTATTRPSGTALATASATSKTTPAEEQAPPPHYVVMIVIDAGRPMYFDHLALPHIDALKKNGVSYDRAYVGELESSTPGVHVTLGTGTLPRQNGFLGFGWAEPNTHKWVDFRTLLADGQIDPVLRSLPVPSVAARLHQFFPKAVSVAGSGHKDYAAVGLGGGAADYVIYGKYSTNTFFPAFLPGHGTPPLTAQEKAQLTIKTPLAKGAEDAWAFNYANIVAHHVKPRLLMINVPETDTWGHWFGPNDTAVFDPLMKEIDNGLGELESTYKALGILNQTDFIITADHAMMESKSATNWKAVQSDIRAAGGQVVRADGSAGGIWLKDPTSAKTVAARLVTMKPDHVEAIFYRSGPGTKYQYIQASPTSWLAGPQVSNALTHLVDTTAGVHGPDLWVLYRENFTVDSNNTSGKWKGTHGGATWKVQHVPLIMAGPGIRSGVTSSFAARTIDIAPTVERLLGLPYIQRDGVILADALTNPLPGELEPERTIAPLVGADADALRLQSEVDSGNIQWPKSVGPIYHCGNKQDPNCGNTKQTATNG